MYLCILNKLPTDNNPTSSAIFISNLVHQYAKSHQVMHFSEWQVTRGERIFLHGPSGSGKTTFLNLLAGILEPQSGDIILMGENVSALSSKQRDKFRARHIGVVFQQFNLVSHLSVLKNIELAAYFAGNNADISAKARHLLTALHLPDSVIEQPANTLSVGQQQRVAIARALINEPEILLVDEPTSALDADARDAFMRILTELCGAANTTLIFVSHDESLKTYLDRAVALTDLCSRKENS